MRANQSAPGSIQSAAGMASDKTSVSLAHPVPRFRLLTNQPIRREATRPEKT
jgi:hypothetical protein